MEKSQLINAVETLGGTGPKFSQPIPPRSGPRYIQPGFGPETDRGHGTVCGTCQKKPEHPCALVFDGLLRDPVCPTELTDIPDSSLYGSYQSSAPALLAANSKACPPHGILFFNNQELQSLSMVAISNHGHPKVWAKPCHDLARAGDSFRIVSSSDCEIFGIYTILAIEKMAHGVKLTLNLVEASGSLDEHTKVFVRYGNPLGQELDAPVASDGTYCFDEFTTSNLVGVDTLEFSNSSIYSFAGRVREIHLHFQANVTLAGSVGFDLEIPISMSGYTGTVLTSGSMQTDSASEVVAATGRVQGTTTLRIRWVAGSVETYLGQISGEWKTLLLV